MDLFQCSQVENFARHLCYQGEDTILLIMFDNPRIIQDCNLLAV